MKADHVPYNGNDVHRKWLDTGWLREREELTAQRRAKRRAQAAAELDKQRARVAAVLDREREARRRRALGLRAMAPAR